jgi:hypothetical protein
MQLAHVNKQAGEYAEALRYLRAEKGTNGYRPRFGLWVFGLGFQSNCWNAFTGGAPLRLNT